MEIEKWRGRERGRERRCRENTKREAVRLDLQSVTHSFIYPHQRHAFLSLSSSRRPVSCVQRARQGKVMWRNKHTQHQLIPWHAIWTAHSPADDVPSTIASTDRNVCNQHLSQDTTRHDTTRHDTTRHDTTRHDTTRHDTTRHGAPHSTAQHSVA